MFIAWSLIIATTTAALAGSTTLAVLFGVIYLISRLTVAARQMTRLAAEPVTSPTRRRRRRRFPVV